MTLKEMSCGQLREELAKAQKAFDETGKYVWLAQVTYEICQRQQKGEWE
jgi:hypothetical protein